MKPRVTYDETEDILVIRWKERDAASESSERTPGVLLDYDRQNHVIGIQIHHVSRLMKQGAETLREAVGDKIHLFTVPISDSEEQSVSSTKRKRSSEASSKLPTAAEA